MIKNGKYLLYGVLGVAGIAGGAYLLNLKRLSSEMEVTVKVLIHKVTLTGIKLRVEVRMKNPTQGTVTVKYPFVKLMYGESMIGSSEVRDLDFDVPKFGERQLDPIYIDLGFFSLATTVPNLLKEYRTTGKLTLTVKAVTTINGNIPYNKTEKIVIGNQQTPA